MPIIITHGRILRSAGDAGGTVSTEAPATVKKEMEVDFKAEADALRAKLKETEERLKASEEKAKGPMHSHSLLLWTCFYLCASTKLQISSSRLPSEYPPKRSLNVLEFFKDSRLI